MVAALECRVTLGVDAARVRLIFPPSSRWREFLHVMWRYYRWATWYGDNSSVYAHRRFLHEASRTYIDVWLEVADASPVAIRYCYVD